MKRLHVHVAVDDLPKSIHFYSAMFAAEPTVVKPDYAKWMLDDPRVNFAISQRGSAPGLTHLGVQVESAEELSEMYARLQKLQTDVIEENGATCCYARSDKYWTTDPQGIPWETFHTLGGIPLFGKEEARDVPCCVPMPRPVDQTSSACCEPVKSGGNAAGGCC
jgi:catechol 2,3-dioxygenase-like lactoylglutathione lyase family enzyme